MYTTIQFQFSDQKAPAPEVVTHEPAGSRAFEVIRIRGAQTALDLFLGWDDVSAAEQALALIEALQEARIRALRRLVLRDAEWAAALPFDGAAVGAAERTERDEVPAS